MLGPQLVMMDLYGINNNKKGVYRQCKCVHRSPPIPHHSHRQLIELILPDGKGELQYFQRELPPISPHVSLVFTYSI